MSEDEKIEIMGKVLSMLNIDAWMCVKDAIERDPVDGEERVWHGFRECRGKD